MAVTLAHTVPVSLLLKDHDRAIHNYNCDLCEKPIPSQERLEGQVTASAASKK